jgi:hypothetical protein
MQNLFIWNKSFNKMRRIVSKQKEKSKERFNQIIVGLVLIFLMVLSILGYSLGNKEPPSQQEKVIYNGIEFVNVNGFWTVKEGNLEFIFQYNPNQVEKIDSSVNPIETYYDKPLYIASESDEALAEIYVNMNALVLRMQKACLNNSNISVECEEGLPIKTCSDNFIVIEESNITGITQENGCVFIKGNKDDLVSISDEFLFKVLGIEQSL